MTPKDVWDEYTLDNTWISETGLCRLHPFPDDSIKLPETGKESVQNENGILFHVYFLLMARLAGCDTSQLHSDLGFTIRSLGYPHKLGLYNRQPVGYSKRYEAHDNYAAIAATSTLFDLPFASHIVLYGNKTGFNFNNVNPENWKLEQQRQGSEVAYYYACAGFDPEPWEWIWLLISFMFRIFSDSSSSWLLSWLRINALMNAKNLSPFKRITIHFTNWVWGIMFRYKWGSLYNLTKGYFHAEHPIAKMSLFVKQEVQWT